MSSKLGKDRESTSYHALLDENHALKEEIESLKTRLEEAEELKRAITEGDLDALVIPGPEEELIFTLDSADRAYRVLVETMNEGTATLGFDGSILYCNRQFAELLKMPLQAVTGSSAYQFIEPENMAAFKAVLEQGRGAEEIKLRTGEGGSLPVYLSISSLQSEGTPNAWCLAVTDLTAQKKNEEILAAERLARSIIEQAAEAIIVCDRSGKIIRFSNSVPGLCGCDPKFQKFEDIINLSFLEGTDVGKSIFPVTSALKGSSILGVEAILEPEDCEQFNLLLNSGPLKNADGEIIGCVVTLTDITERKKVEETLKKAHETLEEKVKECTAELEEACNTLLENEIRLNEAQKIAHVGNWDWNLLTNEIYWSDEIYRIFRLDPLEFGRTYDAFLNYVDPEDRNRVNNATQKALNGEPFSIECGIILPDGKRSIIHAQGDVVFDEKNIPVRIRGIIQDITERKMAEEALEKMDKIRIKEIHHRIKNNLQVICSLLSLEAEKFSDAKMLEALRESRNRVVSMALIHEELYKGDKLDAIDFAAYLHKLTADLFNLYNFGNENISLSMDLEQIYLDMDTAIPLGIIVNELISNALKHAFPAGKKGEIYINLCRTDTPASRCDVSDHSTDHVEKDSLPYTLTVMDNGRGISEEIEFENAESLGLQLINILVEQIDGWIELERDQGTKFTIRFNSVENLS